MKQSTSLTFMATSQEYCSPRRCQLSLCVPAPMELPFRMSKE